MTAYTPKTGQKCHCKKGIERDNCPSCEGSGQVIDFKAIHQLRGLLNLLHNSEEK